MFFKEKLFLKSFITCISELGDLLKPQQAFRWGLLDAPICRTSVHNFWKGLKPFKRQCYEIFYFRFFLECSFSKSLIISFAPFQIF
jgi:hypothetical protein